MLAIVPMFHVNAWGIPYGAFLSGASLLMPGPHLTARPLARVHRGGARHARCGAVPTIWGGILQLRRGARVDLSSVRMGTSGGAAVPRSLLEAFETAYGLRIIQGWGMTETLAGRRHGAPAVGVEPARPRRWTGG